MALCVGSGCVGWGWTDITGPAPSLSLALTADHESPPPSLALTPYVTGLIFLLLRQKDPQVYRYPPRVFTCGTLRFPFISEFRRTTHHMLSVSTILYTFTVSGGILSIEYWILRGHINCIWPGGNGIYVLKRYIYILPWTENMITNKYLGSFEILAEKHLQCKMCIA